MSTTDTTLTDQIEVEFVHEYTTKNTERFQEVVPDGVTPVIGTLYVKKGQMMRLGNPSSLTITITSGDPS